VDPVAAWFVHSGPTFGGRLGAVNGSEAPDYQLDLVTPGICPESASSRKQMRHMPKSRRNARGRPQRWQRLYPRTLNFGVRFHFSTSDFLATENPLAYRRRNGMFMSLSSSRPSSSVFAVVTIVTSMPRIFATFSTLISGKMICSVKPTE